MNRTLLAVGLMFAVNLPVWALHSPYVPLAQTGAATLALKEDPAKDPELLALLAKFKKNGALEKLPGLSVAQRERIMGYYKLARTKQEMGERAVASGVSGVTLGFAEIADVRGFVEEYKKTGKAPQNVPLPYANFKGASEKFAGAANYLAPELESSKQLDDQINAVLELVTEVARKEGEEARKKIASRNTSALAKARQNNPRIPDLESRNHQAFSTYQKLSKANQDQERQQASLMTCSETDLELAAIWQSLYDRTQTPEYKEEAAERKKGGEACKRAADAVKRTAEYRKQIEALDRILKLMK